MTLIDKRIAKAEEAVRAAQEKLKQAKALKQQKEARTRARLQKAERAADTRRKVLVGAMILERVERGEWQREKLLAQLDNFLIRDHDRALFDLKPQTYVQAAVPQNIESQPWKAGPMYS